MLLAEILQQAKEYSARLFREKKEARLLLHNYSLVEAAIDEVQALGQDGEYGDSVVQLAEIAVCFAFTGYLFDYEEAEMESTQQARRFLVENKVGAQEANAILAVLNAATGQWSLEQVEEFKESAFIARDAVVIVENIKNYRESQQLLQLERELLQQLKLNKVDWSRLRFQELMNLQLYSAVAQRQYGFELSQNILFHKKQIAKATPVVIETTKVEKLEEGVPIRSIQTFFRSNYRNHINLSAIADNKANIMISVNSILISVIISILSYHNLASSNPKVLMPVILFLVSGLASLIFAILSARPKVTKEEPNKRNMAFFGNFVQLPLEEYESTMDEIFQDGNLLVSNMKRDLYYLGLVLDKKYRYLSISYNIFMVGFVATVVSFMYVFFT